MLAKSRIAIAVLLATLVTASGAGSFQNIPSESRWYEQNEASSEEKELASNRQYHELLISQSAFYRQLSDDDTEMSSRLTNYRLYLALVEEFARVLSPDSKQRVRLLNAVYERQIEITEARIKGRDNIADRLERKN